MVYAKAIRFIVPENPLKLFKLLREPKTGGVLLYIGFSKEGIWMTRR